MEMRTVAESRRLRAVGVDVDEHGDGFGAAGPAREILIGVANGDLEPGKKLGDHLFVKVFIGRDQADHREGEVSDW